MWWPCFFFLLCAMIPRLPYKPCLWHLWISCEWMYWALIVFQVEFVVVQIDCLRFILEMYFDFNVFVCFLFYVVLKCPPICKLKSFFLFLSLKVWLCEEENNGEPWSVMQSLYIMMISWGKTKVTQHSLESVTETQEYNCIDIIPQKYLLVAYLG